MALVVEYHEELETDLLPEFDLLDVWRGRMTFRRLQLLIQNLPPSSAVVRAINPDLAVMADWSMEAEIAATHLDAYAKVHFQGWKGFPRPGEQIKARQLADARRTALERQRDRVNNQKRGR